MKALLFLDIYTFPLSFNKPINCLSQLLSILTFTITVIFSIIIFIMEFGNRKILSLSYLGLQDSSYIKNESIQINLNFTLLDEKIKIKSCGFFYSLNETMDPVEYFSPLQQNLSLSSINRNGYYSEISFYTRCQNPIELTNLYYSFELDYVRTRSNFLDVENPIEKSNSMYKDTIFNNVGKIQRQTPRQLPFIRYILNYYYSKIVDDKSWLINDAFTSDSKGKYFLSADEIRKEESVQSFPILEDSYYPPIKIFSFIVSRNDYSCQLIKRNFTTIPQIGANIIAVFSIIKVISIVILYVFNSFFKDFELINKIFEFYEKQNHQMITEENQSSKNSNVEIINSKRLLDENKPKDKKQFGFCDNFKFFFCIKSNSTKLKKKFLEDLLKLNLMCMDLDFWIVNMHNIRCSNEKVNYDCKPQVIIDQNLSKFEIYKPNN